MGWLENSLYTSIEAKTSLTRCPSCHIIKLNNRQRISPLKLAYVPRRDTVAFAKKSKRIKYSQSDSRPVRGEPLFIQVEPDGSDAWRLDAVVDALKAGSVSVRLLRSHLLHVTPTGHAACFACAKQLTALLPTQQSCLASSNYVNPGWNPPH